MAKIHIPLEIWYLIASFIPEDNFEDLLGLHVVFYNIIMNARYKDVHIGHIGDYMLKKLTRLKDPAVALRVRRLHLNPQFDTRNSPDQRIPILSMKHRRRSLLPWTSGKNETITRALIAAVKHMSKVTNFTLDWWYDPAAKDLEPVLPVAWKSFGSSLKTVTLGGTLDGVKTLVLSLTSTGSSLTALEELCLEFAPDPILSGLPEKNKADAAAVLDRIIAPFINSVAHQLRRFSISSWSGQLDLSPLFANLHSTFPLLHHFTLRAPFHVAFSRDQIWLTLFLRHHSQTIRITDLAFFRNNAFDVDHTGDDGLLAGWLEVAAIDQNVLVDLQALQIYPTTLQRGFDAFLSLIQRSANTLTSLDIRTRFLSHEDVIAIANIFSHHSVDCKLVRLRLCICRLDPLLLDMLAEKLPGLEELSLHLLWLRNGLGERNEITAENMEGRFYPNWKLRDLGIWNSTGRMDGNCMRILAKRAPSVSSFWGQGNTVTYK